MGCAMCRALSGHSPAALPVSVCLLPLLLPPPCPGMTNTTGFWQNKYVRASPWASSVLLHSLCHARYLVHAHALFSPPALSHKHGPHSCRPATRSWSRKRPGRQYVPAESRWSMFSLRWVWHPVDSQNLRRKSRSGHACHNPHRQRLSLKTWAHDVAASGWAETC